MLRAYFDESGHSSDSAIVAIAGFMGRIDEWVTLEERWRDTLAKHGVAEFHAAKVGRPYGIYKGWTADQAARLVEDAITAITAGDLIGISHSVLVQDYDRVIGSHPWFAKKFGSSYRLCYEGTIQAAVNWLRRNPTCAGEQVELVFANNTEYGRSAQIEGDRYSAHPRWAAEIANVSSAAARDVAGLQAADLLAYETFRYTKAHFGSGVDKPRRSYRRFFEEMAMAPPKYWDAEGLAEFCQIVAQEEPELSTEQRVSLIRHLLSMQRRTNAAIDHASRKERS